jgi:PhnB protein
MPNIKPIPEGFHTVTPHLVCAGAADAMDFYKKAFGAVEIARLPGPDGKLMHGHLRIGDSAVMLADEMPSCSSFGPGTLKGTPVTIHLYVNDADAFFTRATNAGAKAVMPVSDMFWGDRYGVLQDPFGHQWAVATHVRDVGHEEMGEAMAKMAAQHAPA